MEFLKIIKIGLVMLLSVLVLQYSTHARIVRLCLDAIAEESIERIKDGFDIEIEEAKEYSQKLWEAADGNQDDFSYYLDNILNLVSSEGLLAKFVNCISLIRDREKVSLVFQLVEKLNRLNLRNRNYEIGSVLEDAGLLNEGLSDVENGFEDTLNMLIRVTDYKLAKGDKITTAGVYQFLRRFTEEVIKTNWSHCEHIKANFSLCMDKIAEAVIAGEKTICRALEQIRILFDERHAGGDVEIFKREFEKKYGLGI